MAQLDDTSAAVDARPLDTIDDATANAGAIDPVQPNPEGGNPEGEADETLEPVKQVIEAPVSLNAEAKAMFAQLPEEAQRWWADTESTRNRQVQEATTKAATAQREAQSSAARAEAEAQKRFADQLTAFASHYAPQRPNPAQYADMQAYARDNAQYEHDSAQHQQLMQQIGGIGAEADQTLDGHQQQWAQSEAATLRQALPDWFDDAKGTELKSQLTAVGAELGYSPELMAQAGANDIIALHKAHGWKAKAEKYDALMQRRMEPVRAARQAPPTARAGVPGTKTAPVGSLATLYPDDVPK